MISCSNYSARIARSSLLSLVALGALLLASGAQGQQDGGGRVTVLQVSDISVEESAVSVQGRLRADDSQATETGGRLLIFNGDRLFVESGPPRWCSTFLVRDYRPDELSEGSRTQWYVGCGPLRNGRFVGGVLGPLAQTQGQFRLPALVRELPRLPIPDFRRYAQQPLPFRSLEQGAGGVWSGCIREGSVRDCETILRAPWNWEEPAAVWAAAKACEVAGGRWCRILGQVAHSDGSLDDRSRAEFLALAFLGPRPTDSRATETGAVLRRLIRRTHPDPAVVAASALLPRDDSARSPEPSPF